MVAPYYCCVTIYGHSHSIWWRQCHRPFYLFTLLMATKKTYYTTVLTICIGFLIIYAFTLNVYLLWIVGTLIVLSLVSSYCARKIHEYWMGLGTLLGYIVPPVLLTVIFFFILFPVALLSKIFGEKDPLQLKNKKSTTFKSVSKTYDTASFEKPW